VKYERAVGLSYLISMILHGILVYLVAKILDMNPQLPILLSWTIFCATIIFAVMDIHVVARLLCNAMMKTKKSNSTHVKES
jgi:hypothetical protein